ncbi:winged helix-turn-helix domain-containing protein [bacterium]|nr:winged helix-turn-helix domain-containing protein [bacterium]
MNNQCYIDVMKASQWTFFSNHAHILFVLNQKHDITMKEISTTVGITERAVHQIIKELKNDHYVTCKKHGRQNTYTVKHDKPLRHPIEKHKKVADLLSLINTTR